MYNSVDCTLKPSFKCFSRTIMIYIETAGSSQFLDSHHRRIQSKIYMQSIVGMMNVDLEQMQETSIKMWSLIQLGTKKHQQCFSLIDGRTKGGLLFNSTNGINNFNLKDFLHVMSLLFLNESLPFFSGY